MQHYIFFLSTLMFSAMACTNQVQPSSNSVKATDPAVLKAVTDFAQGADNQNVSLLESSLHPDFRTTINQFMGGDGVTILTREAYIGMVRDGKIGGKPRVLSASNFESFGHTAHVQVHMESDALIFNNFLTLVQDKSGKWWVLNDAATAQPKG